MSDDKRYFTVDEANALIPALDVRFGKVMQLRAQLRTPTMRSRRPASHPTADSSSATTAATSCAACAAASRAAGGAHRRARRRRGARRRRQDLDIGLCDFLGEREGSGVAVLAVRREVGRLLARDGCRLRWTPSARRGCDRDHRTAAGAALMSKRDQAAPPDVARMERAIRDWLTACGLDPANRDLKPTPERVARTWAGEFLDGYQADPAAILGDLVLGEADPDVVVVPGLRFHAMCPHHLFPYRGLAHVAYLPAGKLMGFGRLGKLVECFAHRLTLQERITHQIAEALMQHLGARGAGVVLEAEQMCLALPGDKHDTSAVTTSAFSTTASGPTCARVSFRGRGWRQDGAAGGQDCRRHRRQPRHRSRHRRALAAPAPASPSAPRRRRDAGKRRPGVDRVRAAGAHRACDVRRSPTRAASTPPSRSLGVPDLVVNNAGVVARAPRRASEAEWDAVVDANLKGTFNVTRVFLPQMRTRAPAASSTSRRSRGARARRT